MTELWDTTCFSVTRQHVYGHQDSTGQELTVLELLNCKMDQKAKQIARSNMTPSPVNVSITPTSKGIGSIICGKEIISSKIQSSLYSSILKRIYTYWLSSKPTHPINIKPTYIHWASLSLARKEASTPIKVFISKWICGFIPSGQYMVKIKLRQESTYPGCSHPIEDLQHILSCPCSSTSSLRHHLLKDLKDWLDSYRTEHSISTFITNGLSQWLQNPTSIFNTQLTLCKDMADIMFSRQLHIGWHNLLCGFICKDLVLSQQHFLQNIG